MIVGDQACVRERCEIGDDVVIGRGSLVENDTTIGARTKIQANAYVTAYSTLEDDVFIAPCVITTNDNFMGRTEKRHALRKGPTIRRGARIGGGAVLLPGIEIGEEAFVGAGAVVLRTSRPGPSWSATPRGRSVTCRTTNCLLPTREGQLVRARTAHRHLDLDVVPTLRLRSVPEPVRRTRADGLRNPQVLFAQVVDTLRAGLPEQEVRRGTGGPVERQA